MAQATAIGGARAGYLKVSWPFARFQVYDAYIRLRVFPFGTYEFKYDEDFSLEIEVGPFGMGRGIRIHHSRHSAPETLIFWPVRGAQDLLDRVDELRREVNGKLAPAPVTEPRGFPFRISTLLTVVVLWNVAFFYDSGFDWPFGSTAHVEPFGLPVKIALAAVALLSFGSVSVRSIRRVFVKDTARRVDTDPVLYFFGVVASLMLGASILFS